MKAYHTVLSSLQCIIIPRRVYQCNEVSDPHDMDVYAEQWADALHQWLGITDDCVHMVAKVSVMSHESMHKRLWLVSSYYCCSDKSKHA